MQSYPDILVVPITSDLDVTTVPRLRAHLEEIMAGGCRRIILNMRDVTHVDSMGLALMFTIAREIRERGGLLSLADVRDGVYRTLCIACLVDFIPVLGIGPKPTVPVLDPSIRPLWRRTLPVRPDELGAVRDRVGELLRHMPLSPDEVFDMTLASGEALGNAVDHTCAEGVLITVTGYPDRVVLEVTDCGEGFELAEDEEPPASLERGRGIKLMRLLADSVSISHKPSGSGTVVRLTKLVAPERPVPCGIA